ncbi:MAG: RNA-binding protein [Ruminococcus sp.]|jgi:RNA-binding protein YlmH
MDKDDFFKKRIRELCRMAYQRDIVTFTDFLDLNELHIVNNLDVREWGVSRKCFGGYEMSERQITAFIPDALSYEWSFPISCLKIEAADHRFSRSPGHRDYLGALLNLGIDRSMIGDILPDDSCAWVYCLDRMAGFISRELTRVGRVQVHVSEAEGGIPEIARRYEEITKTVASARLDAIISAAFGTSRSSMTPLIESGRVFVNGKLVTSNGYSLREKDIISVRGMGKFQFMEILSQTKKGRYLVRINRYR